MTNRNFSLSPEYALLGLLEQRPAHGYELHQRLEYELGQIWRVSLSQVYNILTRLENQGFICGTVEEQARLPNRRAFHLTAEGRARFERWLKAPCGSSVKAVRVDFLTRLYFARQKESALAIELVDEQIAAIRHGLDQLQTTNPASAVPTTINNLGMELRIRQLSSVLDWLVGIARQLQDMNSTRSEPEEAEKEPI